jgi:glycolate oxidase iron-sulfur subunit
MSDLPVHKFDFKSQESDPLRACVHCGLCLESCPTYRLTGDENNSPRGRLLLWRAEEEGTLEPDKWTDFYTEECVGCLACEPVCPANVPYNKILQQTRRKLSDAGRTRVRWHLRLAARAVRFPGLFNLLTAPGRALRRMKALPHPMVFDGRPAVLQSTASYARNLVAQRQPTGPTVALLTGCLMEALFREINHATVRVLVENNIRVVVPDGQGCCGAFHEHTGLAGVEALFERNRQAFRDVKVDCVVTNSAGCGLALQEALKEVVPVRDVLGFLGELKLVKRNRKDASQRLFVDLPCHLVHGQKEAGIPPSVLEATGYQWELAPCATDCCGSGGVYNIQKPGNARAILREKAAFLDHLPDGIFPILATANHVCMMQWHTARKFVETPFSVRHIIQLLDPKVL